MKNYEELVEGIRKIYEYADARSILEHIAIQVNIIGEVSGICYLEVADRQISVEPYDYFDKDGQITIDCHVLEDIINHKYTFYDALKNNKVVVEGNTDKLCLLGKMILPDEQEEGLVKIDKTDRFYRFKTMLKIHSKKK